MKNLSCILFILSAIAFAYSYAENDANNIHKFVETSEQITLKLSPGNLNDGVFKLEIIPASNKKEIVINKNAFFLFSVSLIFNAKKGTTVATFKNILPEKRIPSYEMLKAKSGRIDVDMRYITYSIYDYLLSEYGNASKHEFDSIIISLRFKTLLPDVPNMEWKTNSIAFTKEELLMRLEAAKKIPLKDYIENILTSEIWPETNEPSRL